MKTSELIGYTLDYWVLRAEGFTLKPGTTDLWVNVDRTFHIDRFQPSTEPGQGHPIIEREKIGLDYNVTPGSPMRAQWFARASDGQCDVIGVGDTALIAAMRAFVASRFGDEVPS